MSRRPGDCLNLQDGQLIWRFHAAPSDEQIVVDGRLESAWPVHGSVLVLGDVAYFAAGWHSGLDGGVMLYAVKLPQCEVVWKQHLDDGVAAAGPHRHQGTAVALLATDGRTIFMGKGYFDAQTGQQSRKLPADSGPVVSFGRSSFLDNNWHRGSSKYKYTWFDQLLGARLVASGPKISCGIVPHGFRADPVWLGMGDYTLAGKTSSDLSKPADWTVPVPVEMRALALAGDVVFVAGRPAPVIARFQQLEESVQGRYEISKLVGQLPAEQLHPQGARLLTFSAADGKQLSNVNLSSPPVFDGLALAQQKVFLSCLDGQLRCFGTAR